VWAFYILSDMGKLVTIGTIFRPHGVHGIMKVKVEPLLMNDLLELEAVFIQTEKDTLPYFIKNVEAIADDMALLTLEEITGKEQVMALAKCPIMAREEDLSHEIIEEDWEDLRGYIMIDEQMGIIGPIDDLLEMPQQVLAQLHYQGKEILVPMHDDLIVEVDDSTRRVVVNMPEGFFEIF
jgi:16S rRNA processing protein RimM